MTTTEVELQKFNDFARQRLQSDPSQPSLIELMELWQIEHPTDAKFAENVAALNEALLDYQRGDRGRPAGVTSAELRKQLDE